MNIPLIDLKAQNRSVKKEIFALWEEIFDSATFIGGDHVAEFESEFANACQTDHCVLVNSGTDALRFIFMALGLRPDEEIITVPNTFIATVEAITQAGGRPVFVDVEKDVKTLDPHIVEAAVTPKTRGIVPVHLYGQPADMDPILAVAEKFGLWVVEDACQAHLASYKGRMAGSIGVAAAFSFYPGKNLGACGEAGAVTTSDPDIARKIRMLRDHGQSRKYFHEIEGYNGRCDVLQAAALRVKLKRLPAWNAARQENAQRYMDLLKGEKSVTLPIVREDRTHVFHLFIVESDHRDSVSEKLNQNGIATGLHYPIPLHLQSAYRYLDLPEGRYPISEAAAKRLLSLPMYPELRHEQIQYICAKMCNALET